MKNKLNALIVLLAVLLVIVPIVSAQFQSEIARWHIAAALNATEKGLGDAEESLRKAALHEPDLGALGDYWILRVKQARRSDRESLPDVLESAISQKPQFALLGRRIGSNMVDESEFALAAKVLDVSFTDATKAVFTDLYPPEKAELALCDNLNLLAYARSLAGVDDAEIELALSDINAALSHYPGMAGLRDTRAWVLFQMGRYEEALVDAEFAIAETIRLRDEDYVYRVLKAIGILSDEAGPVDDSAGDTLKTRDENPEQWNMGVLRYHRGQILEGLGRTDDAEVDYDWLRKRNLPVDDRLH